MKRIIKFAAFAALFIAAAVQSQAQTYGYVSVSPLSAAIVANTSSNTTAIFDVRRNVENLGLQLTAASGGTNAPTITLTFKYSVDGVTFGSVPTTTWALKLPATTASTTITTNIAVNGYGYIQLSSIACSNDTDPVTVTSVKYAVKNPSQ